MYIFDQIILIFFEIKFQLHTAYIFNAHCKKWKHCFELGQKVHEGGPVEFFDKFVLISNTFPFMWRTIGGF